MIKPIDMLGFGPKREAGQLSTGDWIVRITPPSITGLKTTSLRLDKDQYKRYRMWIEGKMLIQDALPDLSPAEREMILTGIGNDDYHRIAGDDPEAEGPTEATRDPDGTGEHND